MVAPPYDKKADGFSTEQPANAGPDSRLSIMETSSRQNGKVRWGWVTFSFATKFGDQFSAVAAD
jgi:hypothetical protein